ncbi:MAG: toprim domain-containing protein [Archaeoglobus sp.]|nr:toprim domain-containing protein [Archaeoglobus sp.]
MRGKLTEVEINELKIIFDELIKASRAGAVIVVEGPSDRESLRNLGIKGEIVLASTQSDVDLVDSLVNLKSLHLEVIILSDWDVEGKKIEKRLDRLFRSRGISVNTEFRKRIFRIVGRDVKNIENLSRYLEPLL